MPATVGVQVIFADVEVTLKGVVQLELGVPSSDMAIVDGKFEPETVKVWLAPNTADVGETLVTVGVGADTLTYRLVDPLIAAPPRLSRDIEPLITRHGRRTGDFRRRGGDAKRSRATGAGRSLQRHGNRTG